MVGTGVRYEFQFKHYDKDFYIGVVGIDSANNTGKMSNLVSVFMPSPVQVKNVVRETNKELLQQDLTGQWRIVSALCGSLLLLAVSLFLAILYFLKRSSKNITNERPKPGDDLTDS